MVAEGVIDCSQLAQSLQGFSLLRSCDQVGENTLRISTPFVGLDGSYLDLFLEQQVNVTKKDNPLFWGYILSDLGETAAYLYSLRIQLSTTRKRRNFVSDVCEALGVEHERGQLLIKLERGQLATLPDAILRLAQACIRVSDLSFSQRYPAAGIFSEEVEEAIDQTELRYEPGPVPVPGRFGGKEVVVDFKVFGPKKTSLVKTVSASTPDAAHVMLNETLARWLRLSDSRKENQLLTVVEEKPWPYREDDLALLKEYSDGVIIFPAQRDRLKQALVGEPQAA
jgi:hypothetical protein